jgi:uncharacterized membrane protein YGL010W
MRKIDQLLAEYGESHRNPTNKFIHWICVPLIFWTVVALLWDTIRIDAVTVPMWGIPLNGAIIALILVMIYYITLSPALSAGMLLYSSACLFIAWKVQSLDIFPLWGIALILFTLAWIFQFWGHKIEGKKPSFLKDLQFLLIGPAWLMHFIYRKAGIPF